MNADQHYYYADQSVVEIRNGSDHVLKQYVWAGTLGVGYIHELLQVGHAGDSQFLQ